MRELIKKALQEPDAVDILCETFCKLLCLSSYWDSLDVDDVERILRDKITEHQID
ncbi:MAG: hypothetical protein J6Y02_20190 [Pseudobutyrivibrio sp.]|nr:hypothetical protein [Pseudobutyrivibrio sp.]